MDVAGDYVFLASGTELVALQAFQRRAIVTDNIGQSLDVDGDANPIYAATLITSEQGTVTWELSADGGASWQGTEPNGVLTEFTAPGSDLRWRATLVSGVIAPIVTSVEISWLTPEPEVQSILDVGNDQGKQVRLIWTRSGNDFAASLDPVLDYAVYRRIDPNLSAATSLESGDFLETEGADRPPFGALAAEWDFLINVPAFSQEEYSVVVPTLKDSTVSEGPYYSTFLVRAATVAPSVYFDSPPDSGYSLDNLAPSPPQSLALSGSGILSWDEAPEVDFDYYTVYGSASPELDASATHIAYATTPSVDVALSPYAYYHVTTSDFAGNESAASSVINTLAVADPGVFPASFALRQSLPNPFWSSTRIGFDLPVTGFVRLRMFDSNGRLVRSLLGGSLKRGRYSMVWPGTDDVGRRVSAGVYFCRLDAGPYSDTRKIVVMQP